MGFKHNKYYLCENELIFLHSLGHYSKEITPQRTVTLHLNTELSFWQLPLTLGIYLRLLILGSMVNPSSANLLCHCCRNKFVLRLLDVYKKEQDNNGSKAGINREVACFFFFFNSINTKMVALFTIVFEILKSIQQREIQLSVNSEPRPFQATQLYFSGQDSSPRPSPVSNPKSNALLLNHRERLYNF